MKLGAFPQRGIGKPLTRRQQQILDTALALKAAQTLTGATLCRALKLRPCNQFAYTQLAEFRSRGLL